LARSGPGAQGVPAGPEPPPPGDRPPVGRLGRPRLGLPGGRAAREDGAVLLYFRADLWRILRTWALSLRDPELRGELDARMGWYIGLGTVPIAVFGFIFRDQIESGGRNLYLIGSALIVLGLVLLYAERGGRKDRDLSGFGPG